MRPRPAASMRLATSRVTRNWPVRLTEMTRLQSAPLIVSAGHTPPIPALLIKTSIRSNLSAISPMVRTTCASSVMSASQAPAPSPISSATEITFGDLSTSASFAPRSRKSSAVDLPMPPDAPVTRTTRPEKSKTRENGRSSSAAALMSDMCLSFRGALIKATASTAPSTLRDSACGAEERPSESFARPHGVIPGLFDVADALVQVDALVDIVLGVELRLDHLVRIRAAARQDIVRHLDRAHRKFVGVLQRRRGHRAVLDEEARFRCAVDAIDEGMDLAACGLDRLDGARRHVVVHGDDRVDLRMRLDPVLRVTHGLVLVPARDLGVEDLDVGALVKEFLLPGRASSFRMRVPWRPHQDDDLRVLRNLLEPELRVFAALLIGIGVDIGNCVVVELRIGHD